MLLVRAVDPAEYQHLRTVPQLQALAKAQGVLLPAGLQELELLRSVLDTDLARLQIELVDGFTEEKVDQSLRT